MPKRTKDRALRRAIGSAKSKIGGGSYSFVCQTASPLGYLHLRPDNERTLDQAILEAMTTLGLERGDRVKVTIERAEE